jgi:RNA polymerase-binding transcription factor DksA
MKQKGRQADRRERILEVLQDERARTCKRIIELRGDQNEDVTPAPADEFDQARSLAEVETHASLIEAAENRLKAIDEALERLAQNHYGLCERCGNEIAADRLKAIPFAVSCVACQQKRDEYAKTSATDFGEKETRAWSLPPEMDESLERQDAVVAPEDRLSVRDKKPFGAELGEFEQTAPAPTMGRRGRIRPKNPAA